MTEGKSYGWRDQIRATMRALGPEDTQPMPRIAREPPPIPPDLVELLRALGVALLNSADSAATTTETLQDVAAAYDVDVQAMVMPTGILFRVGPDEVDLVSVPNRSLRLDQIAQVNDLVTVLERGTVPPSLGLRRLHQILTVEAAVRAVDGGAGAGGAEPRVRPAAEPGRPGAAVLCRARRVRRDPPDGRRQVGHPVGRAARHRRRSW